MDSGEFARRGGWWVAAQGPLLIVAYGVPPLTGHFAMGLDRIVAFLLVAAGLVVGIGTKRIMGSAFTAFPKPVESGGQLVTTGPFAFVRHPIYSAIVVVGIGWTWFWHSEIGAIFPVLLLVFFDLKARREERWLAEAYPGYKAYQARVKRLVPFIY